MSSLFMGFLLNDVQIGAKVQLVALLVAVAGAPEGREHGDAAGQSSAAGGALVDAVWQGHQLVGGADHHAVGIQVHGQDMLDQIAELADAKGLGTAAEAVSLLGIQTLDRQIFIAGGGGTQAVENTGQGDRAVLDLPAGGIAAELAELEGAAMLLVKGDLGLDLLFLHRQQMAQIQFIAQAAEEGHIAPGGQRRIAEGLGVGGGADMSAEGGLGVEAA